MERTLPSIAASLRSALASPTAGNAGSRRLPRWQPSSTGQAAPRASSNPIPKRSPSMATNETERIEQDSQGSRNGRSLEAAPLAPPCGRGPSIHSAPAPIQLPESEPAAEPVNDPGRRTSCGRNMPNRCPCCSGRPARRLRSMLRMPWLRASRLMSSAVPYSMRLPRAPRQLASSQRPHPHLSRATARSCGVPRNAPRRRAPDRLKEHHT